MHQNPENWAESWMAQQTNNALIASDTRGRLRIRLNRDARGGEMMRRIIERFQNADGISNVETNAATGSVVVHYDANKHHRDDIMEMLADVGVVIRDVANGLGEEIPEVGRSQASDSLIATFEQLDRRLSYATGYRVDLKLAFPFLLGGVGVWRLYSSGLGLAEVPAYVLLWYAFDAFFKLNVPSGKERSQS